MQINSWKQFLTTFGNFQEYGYLAYAVRAFFENGGKECHVARVAATTASDRTQWPAKAFFPLPSAAPAAIGSINQVVTPFQCTFTLNGNHTPAARDLLMISGGGVTQLIPVNCILPNGQALMASQLSPLIGTGAAVSWFPAACVICAVSRGNWGNDLLIQITPIDSSTFSLQATVDLGPNTLPTEDEYYRTLSLDPASYNYAPAILAQQSNLVRMDIAGSGAIDLGAAAPLNSGVFYLQGGRDGLSAITLRDFSGGPGDLRGLQLMECVSQVAILAIPDAVFQLPPPVLTPPAAAPDPCFPPPASSTPAPPPPADPTAVITPLTTYIARDLVQLIASDIRKTVPSLDLEVDSQEISQNLSKENPIEHLNIHQQYAVNWLFDRSRDIGYDIWLEVDTSSPSSSRRSVIFHYAPSKYILKPTYILAWGKSLMSFQPSFAAANLPDKVMVQYWNPQKEKRFQGVATRADVSQDGVIDPTADFGVQQGPLAKKTDIVTNVVVQSDDEAKTAAVRRFRILAQNLIEGHGKTVGLPDLRSGNKIQIAGLGRYSGLYHIKTTTHTIGDGGYTTEFTARMEKDPTQAS